MMSRWQFNVLFGIAAVGAVVLFFSKPLHLEVSGLALSGYTAILTFVLSQQIYNVHRNRKDDKSDKDDKGEGDQP